MDNLDALTQAAKLKLQKQQELQEETLDEDIYASIRDEEEDEDLPGYPMAEEDYQISTLQEELDEDDLYDIETYESAIYEGGPSQGQVDLWKKQYGENKILHILVAGQDFVFRVLNRYEYKQIVAIPDIDALKREEIICKTVVLWPRNYNFKTMAAQPGGIPSSLAQIIMENSGFTEEYSIEIL